jgi:hypothetical protein
MSHATRRGRPCNGTQVVRVLSPLPPRSVCFGNIATYCSAAIANHHRRSRRTNGCTRGGGRVLDDGWVTGAARVTRNVRRSES